MHLELNCSLIVTSHWNFRFSEQQWLFTIIVKNIPFPCCCLHVPLLFLSPSGTLDHEAANEDEMQCRPLNYFYSISHLSGLIRDSQMKKAEAEITSLFSRCSGQCEKGWWCCCVSCSADVAASIGDWLPYCSQAAWASTSLPKMVPFHSKRAR